MRIRVKSFSDVAVRGKVSIGNREELVKPVPRIASVCTCRGRYRLKFGRNSGSWASCGLRRAPVSPALTERDLLFQTCGTTSVLSEVAGQSENRDKASLAASVRTDGRR
jgi:hypothetical protein